MMPRISLLRICLLLPSCWLGLVLLWFVLPSPTLSNLSGRLWRQGGSVTRVYDIDDFFHWTDPLDSAWEARSTGRRSFAVTYTYDQRTAEFLVGGVGDGHGDSHSFDLSAVSQAAAPYISQPFTVRSKTGDEDGINLPWFTQADATLLFWDIHHDNADLPLRVRVVQDVHGKVLQILAQSSTLEADEHTPNVVPLMEIIFDDDLLGDQNGQTPFHTRFPQDLRNSSPSRTLIIRRAISAVLVPTWLFIDAVVSVVGETVMFVVKDFLFLLTLLGFYVVLVLACWKRAGSPPFWAWARSFWLTARVAAVLEPKLTERDDVKLRGNGKDSDGSGSEGEDGRVKDGDGPKPLTSVWAFFRSSSPLDDLLVTFEITRGLVQPLNWTQGRRRLGDEEAPIDSGPSVQTENGQGVSKSKYTATDTTESGEKC